MRVLIVARETKQGTLSTVVTCQGDSLKAASITVEYFPIRGRGAAGYAKSALDLRLFLKKHRFEIVHAHYSLSAFVATLAGARPLVVSLMGSDVFHGLTGHLFMVRMTDKRWSALIVKSEEMKQSLGIESALVLPNGVDMDVFKPASPNEARAKVGYDSRKHVIFVGDPRRREKNFILARNALALMNRSKVDLHVVSGVPHEELPNLMNAADVLLLSSKYEGSPNVIKEAMACNCPIVATDVGDIRWIISDTEGCYLTSFDPQDVASKIQMALDFGKKTRGRERLIELGLDSGSIAKRIIQVYQSVIQ